MEQFSKDLTYSIFLMHSNSYAITDISYLFIYSIKYYHNFYFEVTLFLVDSITVVIEVIQVVKFKPILLFKILRVNTKIFDYTIDKYFYRHSYFTVCALQVISYIVLLIQYIIVSKRNLIAVANAECKHFFYNLNYSIFLKHSHSYFITNIYFFVFHINPILIQFLLWIRNLHSWKIIVVIKVSQVIHLIQSDCFEF